MAQDDIPGVKGTPGGPGGGGAPGNARGRHLDASQKQYYVKTPNVGDLGFGNYLVPRFLLPRPIYAGKR